MLDFLTRLLIPPFQPGALPSRKVAIIVPASTRSEFTSEEEISLRHLRHYLGRYDKYLIAPRGTRLQVDGFTVKTFSRKYFGSMRAHSRLLYTPRFWREFRNYEYVLMYHLDALVFRDELLQWCETGVDYIGAPFMPCPDTPEVKEPRVGNGGFALMKVNTLLKVLHNRYRLEPARYWEDCAAGLISGVRALLRYPRRLTPRWLRGGLMQPLREGLQKMDEIEVIARNNDEFWSQHASRYVPEFRVADWKTGLRFAFEAGPRLCYKLNGHQLPFGCHAWQKYDRSFWAPFLLTEAVRSPASEAYTPQALNGSIK